ncbi:MAG: acetyl-CoA carboxylase carboxyltransferase subunit beta [Eubacteriales bacterium]|nr:acetyl-CoA carboxylase carboxyltransferase subunit beta [Eubacteriales bacterium]
MIEKSLFRDPKLRLEGQENAPEKPPVCECPQCRKTQELPALAQALFLCPRCGYHYKISARDRVGMTLDEGSFREMGVRIASKDPLSFPGYQEKLEQAQKLSGEREAVITGIGSILGQPCAFFTMEYQFMMGSMGAAAGEKLTRLFERALERRLPVVGYTISGGARVQEGILSLMQMAKVSGAVRRHADERLLYIAVLCDATTGGVAASFAMQADIILAETGALIGFAGPRVIEQTTRQKLPEGFQRAEFQLDKGFVGKIVKREDQRDLLGLLLRMHTGGLA